LRIIEFRKQELRKNQRAMNPFNSRVFHRTITFRIDGEEALSEFWDYWLNAPKNIIDLSDCVRLFFGFCLWLTHRDFESTIVVVGKIEEKTL